ncbi:MAG: polysaccharide biosynthesis/export family protein, partial [Phycisphaerae bacterium]|nr:polysaccharide biosynthesis/export family protein [Phycisphaerae bacterium]
MSSTLPPKPRMHRSSQTLATLGLCLLAAGFAGCNGVTTMTSVFNGLLNPADVGSYGVFGREGTLDIRSSLTLQDAPTGVMGVSDPQPEDLVPLVEEYEYAIGDGIAVRIYELLQRGTETAVQVTIDETGNINLPVLGRIEVVGLTLPEIEAEIVDQVVQRNILLEPEIIVEPAIRRKLSYTIYGTISQPNLYPLGQYNLRLLDAINVAGGLVDAVTEIYVVRNQNFPEPVLVSNRSGHHRQIAGTPRGEVLLSGGLGNGAGAAPATSTTMFSGDPKGSVLTTGDSGTTLP